MNGVAVVRYKLVNNAGLTAVIPATRIFSGAVPEGTATPCIAITTISATERLTTSMGEPNRFITERVQVTVYANTYPLQKSYMALIRTACSPVGGTINGVKCDSVLPAGEGPDFFDDVLMVYEQSQDFMVKFSR